MVKKLPKVGLEAVLLLKDFQRNQKLYNDALKSMEKQTRSTASAITSSSKKMATSLEDLVKNSQVLNETMELAPKSALRTIQDLGVAYGELEKGTQVNIQRFDELLNQGFTVEEALQGASSSALEAGTAMKSLAAGATLAATAIGTSIAVVKDAVSEYTDFAEQVRTVRYELGASAEDASGWVRAAESAGLSSTTFNRAITQLSAKMGDYKLQTLEGKDVSNAFTRSMDALGISILDSEGNLRNTEDVMREVNTALRDLGEGTITTEAAMKIYGYAGRDMLKVVHDQSGSMDELVDRTKELGAATTELAQEQYEEWRAATSELKLATQGVKNYIARQWIPVLTDLAKILTEIIDKYRRVIASSVAFFKTLSIAGKGGITSIADGIKIYDAVLDDLLNLESDAKRAEEDLAQARDKAKQDTLLAAEAEEKLADARREALADLNQDLLDLNQDYLDKEEKIYLDHSRRMTDLLEKFRRDDIITALKQAGQREDLWLRHQQKLSDIEQDTVDKQREIRDELAKDLARFDEDAARKREKALNKHLDNLWKIRNKYLDTVEEAARKNDAVAVVRAMRVAAQQRRDENHRYARERSELDKDLAIKRRRIQEDATEKEQEAQKKRDDEIKAENDKYNQQLALLEAKFAREKEITRLQRQWEIDDLNLSKQRQLTDLQNWYNKERAALDAQIAALTQQAVNGIASMGSAVAAAAGAAVEQIMNTTGNRIEAVGGGVLYHTGTRASESARSAAYTGGRAAIDQWYRRTTPGGYRAEGGVDVVNRPTTFVAGERGAEVAAFIPLHNVQHSFNGNMNVGFEGLPSGMNTTQIQSIVYDTMMDVAKSLMGAR